MVLYSRYNVCKTKGEETWVYNTLTSAFIKISTQVWSSLSESSDKELLDTLCRQGIIVDDNETEIEKYKYFCYTKMFDKTHWTLSVAPTMRCNFNCPYCFEGEHKIYQKMGQDVVDALVSFIKRQYELNKNIFIIWFGGEPLLAFDVILSICSALNKENVKFKSSMITNGSLMTNPVINDLPALNLTNVQITLNGTSETHDKRRYYKKGKPSFADIDNNINNLLNNTDIQVTIQVGIDKTNQDAYQKVFDYMKSKYFKFMDDKRLRIGHNEIRNRNDYEGSSACFTDKQLFENSIANVGNEKYKQLMPRLPGLCLPCMYRSDNNLAVDSLENIYKCLEHLGQPQYKIGNIVDGHVSFGKVSKAILRNSAFDDEACKSCNVLPICGGGCPVDREKFKQNDVKPYCSYYKKYLTEMLPYLYEQMKR